MSKPRFYPGRLYWFSNIILSASTGATPTSSTASSPHTSALTSPRDSLERLNDATLTDHVYLCPSSPKGTRHSLFIIVTSRSDRLILEDARHLYMPIHPATEPEEIYPYPVTTINPMSSDPNKKLWLYLGRIMTFHEGHLDLDYTLLRNGVTRDTLERINAAVFTVHGLAKARYHFVNAPSDADRDDDRMQSQEPKNEDTPRKPNNENAPGKRKSSRSQRRGQGDRRSSSEHREVNEFGAFPADWDIDFPLSNDDEGVPMSAIPAEVYEVDVDVDDNLCF
ncbi:uncharacterized protein SPPG_00457 [Spizellomyces punctatus DAOM BR117]|uniref:Uncharacterized protein n=1 Tax=Spizellomyces punctatus (strain DAOM BR117) TaxID=645134 RepID=A0A0L0HUI9_SPIPD|nr:uncharacterized protein SPPG_00457 [Spizellomyces punctatus DAOM BR117]KND04752.1 hypothetical protein SPPG_00457 [Spizellomyces punctatus DAOM BR117]|eukprot:XP_016612791.1 hypothetical protein SPPG_00457 [Spizellomyces punctatus DAOM BR117]